MNTKLDPLKSASPSLPLMADHGKDPPRGNSLLADLAQGIAPRVARPKPTLRSQSVGAEFNRD